MAPRCSSVRQLGVPLKTKDTQGVYTEAEIYDKLADIYQ
jgi:hypothetical protein